MVSSCQEAVFFSPMRVQLSVFRIRFCIRRRLHTTANSSGTPGMNTVDFRRRGTTFGSTNVRAVPAQNSGLPTRSLSHSTDSEFQQLMWYLPSMIREDSRRGSTASGAPVPESIARAMQSSKVRKVSSGILPQTPSFKTMTMCMLRSVDFTTCALLAPGLWLVIEGRARLGPSFFRILSVAGVLATFKKGLAGGVVSIERFLFLSLPPLV